MVSLKRLQREALRNPTDAACSYRLGVACLQAGHAEPGKEALQRALGLEPHDAIVCIALGQAFVAISSLDQAEQAYRMAIGRAPTDAQSRFLLGRLLLMRDRPQEAAEQLKLALQHGGAPEVRHLRIAALERCGDASEAISELTEVLRLDPQNLEARQRQAQLLQDAGRHSEAVASWRQVVTLSQNNPQSLTHLAVSLSKEGVHLEAIELFKQLLNSPAIPKVEAYANLGMALRAAGRSQEAISALLEAVKIDPNSAQAACDLGVILHDSGQVDAGINALKKAAELAPQWATAHYNLGLALKSAGHIVAARAALHQAAALAPDDGEIQAALQASFTERDEIIEIEPLPTDYASIITGNLFSIQLPDVLEFVRVQRMTGTLHLESETGAGALYVRKGTLTGALSPQTPTLRSLLERTSLISEEHLRLIDSNAQALELDNPENLSSFVSQLPGLDANRLRTLIQAHAVRALRDLFSWKVGRFSFQQPQEGQEAAQLPALEFDLQFLILETMKLMDEGGSNKPALQAN